MAAALPPSVVVKELKPQVIKKVDEKTWVVDFGQNMAGWIRLQVRQQ